MKAARMYRWRGAAVVMLLLCGFPVAAQAFSSGSTGALGAFAPAANTTVTLPPDGVLNYTTVNIPSGVTVTFTPNAANTPVTMLATSDVTIAGTVSVDGADGVLSSASPLIKPGGAGGPGGFAGGHSGGPNSLGSPGLGPGGGIPSAAGNSPVVEASYGAPSTFVTLIPLFGGSGGAGRAGSTTDSGSSGAGGGGAIVIASSTQITVTGLISANGGTRPDEFPARAGDGSGGAIRLVAPSISNTGTIRAKEGIFGSDTNQGHIRLEAQTFGSLGTLQGFSSTSNTLGPITAASTPALMNMPTLTFSAVGGVAAPGTVAGSYVTADVSLPQGTTNSIPVTLRATNIPVGTIFTVVVAPQANFANTFNSAQSIGTFSSSMATASVDLPAGQVSLLKAFGSFTVPVQVAALYPMIDGEPVDRVLVAATFGGLSMVTLITRSGKEVPADRLWPREPDGVRDSQ